MRRDAQRIALLAAIFAIFFNSDLAFSQDGIAGPSTDPYATDYAKAANAHDMQEIARYTQERDSYFDLVRLLYFAVGCNVFPNPGIIVGLLVNGNKHLEEKYDHGPVWTYGRDRQKGLLQKLLADAQNEGTARASQTGACDYWHQHPEVLYKLRQAADAVLRR